MLLQSVDQNFCSGLGVEEFAKALSDLPHKDRLLSTEVVEFTPRDNSDAEAGVELVTKLASEVCAAFSL